MKIIRSENNEDFVNLEYIFESNQFLIPSYQRMYEWNLTEVKFLWGDLIEAHDKFLKTGSNYFMGIAFYNQITAKHHDSIPSEIMKYINLKSKKQSFLSDGQQRFTSFTLLLSALLKVAEKKLTTRGLKDEEREGLFNAIDKIKGSLFLDNENTKTRVVPVCSDGNLQEKFQNIISKNYIGSDLNVQLKNLQTAYNKSEMENTKIRYEYSHIYFLNEIINKFNYGNGFVKEFTNFINFLLDNSIFILVEREEGTSNETRDFFNKLNSRGKSLDDITILKNEIYSMLMGDEEKVIDESEFNKIWEKILYNYSNDAVMDVIKLKVKKEVSFTDEKDRKRSFKNSFKESGYDLNKLIKHFKDNGATYTSNFFETMRDDLDINIWDFAINYDTSKWFNFRTFIDINVKSNSSSDKTTTVLHELKIFMSLTGHELWRLLREKVIREAKHIDSNGIDNFISYIGIVNSIIKRIFVLTKGKIYVSKYDSVFETYDGKPMSNGERTYNVETIIKVYDRCIYKLYCEDSNNFNSDELIQLKNKQMEKSGSTLSFENEVLEQSACNFGKYSNYSLLKQHKLLAPLIISEQTDKLIKSLENGNWDIDHILEINEYEDEFIKVITKINKTKSDPIDLCFNLHPLPNSKNRSSSKENSALKENYYIESLRYIGNKIDNVFTQHISELLEKYKGKTFDLKNEHQEMINKLAQQLKKSINLPQ